MLGSWGNWKHILWEICQRCHRYILLIDSKHICSLAASTPKYNPSAQKFVALFVSLWRLTDKFEYNCLYTFFSNECLLFQRYWNPNVCFNFLDAFFTYVKRCLAQEIIQTRGEDALQNLQTLPLISIMLEWNPGMPVCVAGHYSNEDDPILPEWFINHFERQLSEQWSDKL